MRCKSSTTQKWLFQRPETHPFKTSSRKIATSWYLWEGRSLTSISSRCKHRWPNPTAQLPPNIIQDFFFSFLQCLKIFMPFIKAECLPPVLEWSLSPVAIVLKSFSLHVYVIRCNFSSITCKDQRKVSRSWQSCQSGSQPICKWLQGTQLYQIWRHLKTGSPLEHQDKSSNGWKPWHWPCDTLTEKLHEPAWMSDLKYLCKILSLWQFFTNW